MPKRRSRALFFLGRLLLAMRAHNAFEAAAAIAFWFFLSLVPLLVLLGFLVGQVARSRGVDTLVAPLLEVIPDTAEDIVRKELERMATGTSSIAPLGVLGYFWTASSGLHNLMDVFETAARARKRAWWKQRAIALAWVVAGLAAACVLAWSLVRLDAAMNGKDLGARPVAGAVAGQGPGQGSAATPGKPGTPISRAQGAIKRRVHRALHTPVEQAIASAVMLVIGLALLAGFYRFAVAHAPNMVRRVWPGALTAVAGWLVVSWAFGLYAVSMASYALYYGSLAAVAVMLVWLYITSLALVVGAEVNVLLERAQVRS